MRDIKFRAKDIETGQWLYGWIFGDKAKSIVEMDKNYPNNYGVEAYYTSVVEPETVGQYTGLKDKNGKKVFEGDIIECGDGKVPTLIEWHDESHSFLAYNLKRKEYHRLDKYFLRYIGEIIGNIHENPELMEVTE
jgi:uncharacterized phage protein (TIGR01671 family)